MAEVVRKEVEKETDIEHMIEEAWKGLNIRLFGGMGTPQKPYHIVILDHAFADNEVITARKGKIEQVMNNTFFLRKIAEKLVEKGIRNFSLYGVSEYTNYGFKEN